MVNDDKSGLNAVLTAPLLLENESDMGYRAPNLLKCIISLFKDVRPGFDLTRFELPPLFNLPKSQLQSFGETVYCVGDDMLSKCTDGKSPIDRFAAVVAWSISTSRPVLFGVAPYNPILGETHHVSRGTLNVMLEQVSHHPPVTALHATDETKNIETIWCHSTIPRFCGTSVEGVIHGKRQLKLLTHGENYAMNSPNLLIGLVPPGTDWIGDVTVQCEETGLEAELCYRTQSLLGLRGTKRSIKGKIINSKTSTTLYEIHGHWDRTVQMKNMSNGKSTILYDAKTTITRLKTPVVKDQKGLRPSESAVVWAEVSECILRKEWEKARVAKKAVEEKERDLRREREAKGETWIPNHFNLWYTKEGGWDCSPKQKWVPPAPIFTPY